MPLPRNDPARDRDVSPSPVPDEPLKDAGPGAAPRPGTAATATLFLYGCVMIAGGHGAAPVFAVLLWVTPSLFGQAGGAADLGAEWTSGLVPNGVLAGWAGAVVLLVAQAFPGLSLARGSAAGVVLLTLSLLWIVDMSEVPAFTLLTALPFAFAAMWLLRETFAAAKK